MVVLEPLKIIVENFLPVESNNKIVVPNFPAKPDLGNHEVYFNNIIFIEKSDFMEVSMPSFNLYFMGCFDSLVKTSLVIDGLLCRREMMDTGD